VNKETISSIREQIDYEQLLAGRTRNMGASMIREALKVIARPGIVSLAGGLPAPESFPLEIIKELAALVLHKYNTTALQYGPSEGFPALREALVDLLNERDIAVAADDVIISTGSQGALLEIGKILISKGDKVAVEAPTYMGALAAFNPYEPNYVGIATDENGVIPESLEELLKHHRIKFIYLVPTFQNPSGMTITLERRKKIADIVMRYGALIIEDDPYGVLRYRGEAIPPIKIFAPDNTVYISTFSKILSPGLRIGFCVASPLIKKWMVLAKQGIDLHTSSFDQAIAAEYIAGGYLKQHLPAIINVYRPKLDSMLAALDSYFPDGFTWSRPEGGMFVWAQGPAGLDTDRLYRKAIERNVAFIPGKYFYTGHNQGLETMRLNFTMAEPETIRQAVKTLAEVIRDELK